MSFILILFFGHAHTHARMRARMVNSLEFIGHRYGKHRQDSITCFTPPAQCHPPWLLTSADKQSQSSANCFTIIYLFINKTHWSLHVETSLQLSGLHAHIWKNTCCVTQLIILIYCFIFELYCTANISMSFKSAQLNHKSCTLLKYWNGFIYATF